MQTKPAVNGIVLNQRVRRRIKRWFARGAGAVVTYAVSKKTASSGG